MNKHLTEQQLIDYQFKLASEPDLHVARAHLDECEECRQRLQRLVRKFASLDLLRDEVGVSESLLSKTVENAVQARPGRVIWLYRLPALGAVAAAVIVGAAVLLVSNSQQDNRIAPTAAPGPLAQDAAPAAPAEQEYAVRKDQPMSLVTEGVGKAEPAAPSKPSLSKMTLTEAQSRATSEATGRVGLAPPEPARRAASVAQPLGAMEIAEQPPFAPASAIELVVLPRRENVQLTIYNGADLTLVRERRNLTLKRGWNWLQFMWADETIDPTSLALDPVGHGGSVQVQELVFPPWLREWDPNREVASSEFRLGRWLIHSEVSGQVPFEVTYFTRGLSWRAFYMGTLSQDEKTMYLEGYVRVSNDSGEDYENAQTRLVVGRIHLLDEIALLAMRQYPYGPDVSIGGPGGVAEAVNKKKERLNRLDRDASRLMESLDTGLEGKAKEVRKEGLSEYFLYTIEGTETIPNQWGKRLLSFEANDVPITSLYKYDEERWGTETIRFLSFANDEKHKLGETPIPDGAVRIYGRAGEQEHLSYVGAMNVKYIPVNEEVELNLGPARLVEVKPILMDYKVENHTFDNQGNISGWDEVRTWRIEIANTRSLPVDIEVTRGFETPYWTLKPADAAVSYEKYDVTHARFKLTVEPQGKRVVEYTATTYHGVRQEALSNAR